MTFSQLRFLAASVITALALSCCSDTEPVYHQYDDPQRLSDWNLLALQGGELIPSQASLVFWPANQLFSDYAHKLRTLWMPEGSTAHLVDGEIEYPVGTILSKTF